MNKQIRQLIKSSKRKVVFVTEPGEKISDLVDFIKSFGLNVYQDPTDYNDYGSLIICNQKMTFGDYIKEYEKFGNCDWAEEAFGDKAKQELDKV